MLKLARLGASALAEDASLLRLELRVRQLLGSWVCDCASWIFDMSACMSMPPIPAAPAN
jgi:hypothetical protein